MDDLNITMEEYIKLNEEKARKRGKCLTGKLLSMVRSDKTSLSEYDEEEQSVLYFNDLFPFSIVYPDDLKLDKGNDDNEIDLGSFIMGLNVNIVAWNHFVNGMQFNLIKNLYVPFGILFDPKRYYKEGDCPRMLRRRRLIACSIAGRSQAPKKVTVTDLFFLRGLDVRSVNIPYLLARYLRRFAVGRKSGALISGGQFVARLAEHFGLLTEDRLQGLTVIALALPIIDMTELEGDAGGVVNEALVAPRGSVDGGEMP
nr:hypothetical protein [Tanacetum cinerariifolium]